MTKTNLNSSFQTGIRGLCPRCKQGHLFKGYLTLANKCEACSLDYSYADPADGPAFFSMTITAVPALLFGIWLQSTFEPPIWVHILTTLPITIMICVLLLRPIKGWLVCSQYIHKAEEGRIDPDWNQGRD
ncbi:DUF983 domain-containing protein [Brucella sp. 21LCYQ03]|nr:DUF983 domain-containing protein [Brucella sp. 21LCYQ03]